MNDLSNRTDGELIEESKRGNTAAFEVLFNKYQKRVYNVIYRMVGNEQDAADLTQDVFVRVYNSLHSLRTGDALLGWLRTVAVNITRDHFRKKGRTLRTDSLDSKVQLEDGEVEREIEDWSGNPERLLDRKDLQEAVQRAMNSLSDEHRVAVAMHHIEGMDVKDMAAQLKVPVGTVKSRLARAREELKRKLGHYVE
jgi:RNA polymerase sigma-70 factor (ECF subfamily)